MEKIDPRLREEIERLERSGASGRRLSVIVEPSGTPPAADERGIGAMGDKTRTATDPLRRRLAEMGVTDVDQLVLAAGIVAELSAEQIRTLAADAAVKRITWNAVDKVTV